MLNKEKLLKELNIISSRILKNNEFCYLEVLNNIWQETISDPNFLVKVLGEAKANQLPVWQNNLDDIFPISEKQKDYSVLAVDGSQIYPDRHMPGNGCFLINLGGIFLEYNNQSKVDFFSEPTILMQEDIVSDKNTFSFSKDLIDLAREAYELKAAFDISIIRKKSLPFLCLLDGSLIFWHLEAKTTEVRNHFFFQYIETLDKFYQHKIPIAGYISSPKSKELIKLLKFYDENINKNSDSILDKFIDSKVAEIYLPPNFRSTVFESNVRISSSYPKHLKPYFFYMNVGAEIARVEIPAWMSENSEIINNLASITLDQVKKGSGYPVCLAEAHEQAVIKGPDRDFFYHLICKINIEDKKKILMSQKSIKKRGIKI